MVKPEVENFDVKTDFSTWKKREDNSYMFKDFTKLFIIEKN